MKKITIIAAMLLAASAVSAADFSVFSKYDYDNFSNTKNASLHRSSLNTAATFGKFGTADIGVVNTQVRFGSARDSETGYELGYSNSAVVGPVTVSGRISATRYSNVDSNEMRFNLTGSYPVSERLAVVADVDHVRIEGESLVNRGGLGVDVVLTDKVKLRALATRANFIGVDVNTNGLSMSLTYKL